MKIDNHKKKMSFHCVCVFRFAILTRQLKTQRTLPEFERKTKKSCETPFFSFGAQICR